MSCLPTSSFFISSHVVSSYVDSFHLVSYHLVSYHLLSTNFFIILSILVPFFHVSPHVVSSLVCLTVVLQEKRKRQTEIEDKRTQLDDLVLQLQHLKVGVRLTPPPTGMLCRCMLGFWVVRILTTFTSVRLGSFSRTFPRLSLQLCVPSSVN